MENVLIISSSKNASEVLSNFMKESFRCGIRTAETSYQAKNILDSVPSIELAVINSPLTDESGAGLAEYIIENTSAYCILIIKAELAEKHMDRFGKSGIIVISKPFNRSSLYQLINTIDIAIRRSWKLYEETVSLEKKIEEIRTTDKAKFMLMQYRSMTEAEAHEYLEQYAMNKRKKKSLAALEIIDKLSEQYL